jgi:heat shock protein HtpX
MLDRAYRWAGDGWAGALHAPRANPPLNPHKIFHVSQSALLVGGMVALLGMYGLSLGQAAGLSRLLQRRPGAPSERASPALLLRQLGARRLAPGELPLLMPILESISRRAGLPRVPELYWIPGATMNAFALGEPDHPTIAVTEGLLRHLTLDELAGILAHEVAHLRNSDTATLALAHGLTTAIELMSLIGLILLRLEARHGARNAPGAAHTPLLLSLAPAISRLLQLALSRIRELDADLDAIELSGSAHGLMRALQKLEHHHGDETATGQHGALGMLLRSHPETALRLRRLFENGLAAHRVA